MTVSNKEFVKNVADKLRGIGFECDCLLDRKIPETRGKRGCGCEAEYGFFPITERLDLDGTRKVRMGVHPLMDARGQTTITCEPDRGCLFNYNDTDLIGNLSNIYFPKHGYYEQDISYHTREFKPNGGSTVGRIGIEILYGKEFEDQRDKPDGNRLVFEVHAAKESEL